MGPHAAKQRRILVIDDQKDMRDMLALLLPKYGYSVTVVPNGEAGVELVREQRFHVVLCDVILAALLDAAARNGGFHPS